MHCTSWVFGSWSSSGALFSFWQNRHRKKPWYRRSEETEMQSWFLDQSKSRSVTPRQEEYICHRTTSIRGRFTCVASLQSENWAVLRAQMWGLKHSLHFQRKKLQLQSNQFGWNIRTKSSGVFFLKSTLQKDTNHALKRGRERKNEQNKTKAATYELESCHVCCLVLHAFFRHLLSETPCSVSVSFPVRHKAFWVNCTHPSCVCRKSLIK